MWEPEGAVLEHLSLEGVVYHLHGNALQRVTESETLHLLLLLLLLLCVLRVWWLLLLCLVLWLVLVCVVLLKG